MKFSTIHPASESDFLSGIFLGESIVMQISFVMLIFLLFLNQFFGEGQIHGANCLREKTAVSGTKHRNELFSKGTLTNSCTVCHIRTLNMLKTSKPGLISWT